LPHRLLQAAAVPAICALAACTSGNSAIEPTVTGVNPVQNGKLQFAVGTAAIGLPGGAFFTGLNTLATLRQPNGNPAALVNTPAIAGPTGFVVPALGPDGAPSGAGTDAGTNRISGTPQTLPGTTPVATTFGQSGGVFGFGFAPLNSTTSGSPDFTSVFQLPIYNLPPDSQKITRLVFLAGPPAWPTTRNGQYLQGFLGYTFGFIDFAVVPVAGTYTLDVAIPGATGPFGRLTAAATLRSTTPLPPFTPPTLTLDGRGGGLIAVNVPTGVTETYVIVRNLESKCSPSPGVAYYTVAVPGTGPHVVSLPDNLGPVAVGSSTQSICTAADSTGYNATHGTTGGDAYWVYAVGFDYPVFTSAYPQNTSQMPVISGANGQADVTSSWFVAGQSN
jgi:hypothetical protein